MVLVTQEVPLQRRLLLAAVTLTVTASTLSLVGWAAGIRWLQGGLFLAPIHANAAAAGLLLSAATIALLHGGRILRGVGLLASGSAAVLAVAALSAHRGGPGTALDALLLPGAGVPEAYARMSTIASVVVLGIAAALWVRILLPSADRTFVALLVLPVAASFVALIGFAFGAQLLTHPGGGHPPGHLIALGLGFLAFTLAVDALPGPLVARLNATTPGMRLVRRLVPFSVIWLITGGLLLNLSLGRAGHGGHEAEVAVVILTSGLVISALVIHAGVRFDRQVAEIERTRTELEAATALAHRQALELNDDVVQILAAAWLAHDLARHEQERDAVRQALGRAQAIASTLLRSTAGVGSVPPGSLVRHPAGSREVEHGYPSPPGRPHRPGADGSPRLR